MINRKIPDNVSINVIILWIECSVNNSSADDDSVKCNQQIPRNNF